MENSQPLRHLDNGEYAKFSPAFVICPACGEVGKSTCQSGERRLICLHCAFQSSKFLGQIQLSISTKCYVCQKMIYANQHGQLISGYSDNIPDQINITCPTCKTTYQADVIKAQCFWQGCDNYFGLPLFLTIDSRKGKLWAYNEQHLQAIKSYVQADLRERTEEAKHKNGSLFSRLPRWIKSAKNREMVLKLIEKLETKYQTISTNN